MEIAKTSSVLFNIFYITQKLPVKIKAIHSTENKCRVFSKNREKENKQKKQETSWTGNEKNKWIDNWANKQKSK